MMNSGLRDVSFLRGFRDFYAEVIRLRQRAELNFDIGASIPNGGSGASEMTVAIWTRLADLLERQARLNVSSAGDVGHGLYREAQYVMAALADEIFLNVDWPGREYWTNHLLESHFFKSNIAGEEIFSRIERVLREPVRSYTDIYGIYLMALSLGFRGKYRGRDDGGWIENARQRLFERIYRRKPQLLGEDDRLFSECYDHTLDLGDRKKLPSPIRWFGALAIAVALWLGVSTIFWRGLAGDLEQQVQQIRVKAPTTVPAGAGTQPPGQR